MYMYMYVCVCVCVYTANHIAAGKTNKQVWNGIKYLKKCNQKLSSKQGEKSKEQSDKWKPNNKIISINLNPTTSIITCKWLSTF